MLTLCSCFWPPELEWMDVRLLINMTLRFGYLLILFIKSCFWFSGGKRDGENLE